MNQPATPQPTVLRVDNLVPLKLTPDEPRPLATIGDRQGETDGGEPSSAFYRLPSPNGQATRNGVGRPGPRLSPTEWFQALTPANSPAIRLDAPDGRA
jgi:hypothetical protein